MKIHGSLSDNVHAAMASARRHRGKVVYPETLEFWNDVLGMAKEHLAALADADTATIARLTDELESELQARAEPHH